MIAIVEGDRAVVLNDDPSDHPSGNARDDRLRLNILTHKRVGANHALPPDGGSGRDHALRANIGAVTDLNSTFVT